MSAEKTEQPTHKKLKDARERGQVVRSRDLASAVALTAVTLLLWWMGPTMMSALTTTLSLSLSQLGDRPLDPMTPGDLSAVVWTGLGRLALIAGPVAVTGAVLAAVAQVAQTGWVYSPQAMQLNWGRLNPATGFKRFMPSQAGADTLKAVVAASVLGWVGWRLGMDVCEQAGQLVSMAVPSVAVRAWDVLWRFFWQGGLALLALAAADYGLQYYRVMSQLKMSRQDIRDEAKSNEGSPELKSRVRRVQREMAKRRMLTAVKQSTVVIVNPTHYAVAIEYHRDRMAAPIVVAKGKDHLALRIRQIARENGVPIVENVALARALHAGAEIGESIPAALFGAVAEVLAYLVRIKQLML